MTSDAEREPPFDRRWLDLLVEVAATDEAAGVLHDLYLERRFEVRVTAVGDEPQLEECRSDGVAAQWLGRDEVQITATTGTSPRALTDLLAPRFDCQDLLRTRPLPAPEIDAPRNWRDWALRLMTDLAPLQPQAVFLCRSAVVVNRQGWVTIGSPPLVRVQTRAEAGCALLAVAGHPQLDQWLEEMVETGPNKRWCPPSGHREPVVLTNGTGGALVHELLGHLLEGDIVGSGDSPLHDLLGTKVAPTSFNLCDDPTRFDLPGAFDHDDEGVAAAAQDLVTEGRLSGFLCDQRSAKKLDGRPGRGRRASWNRPPVPRLSNLVIAAGETPPELLEKDLRHGLVVTRIGGATVDPVSGRAVIRVERGWEIRNGRRRRALAGFELIGSVLQILAGIDSELGADQVIDWRLGWCIKGGWPLPTGSVAPTMLVHGFEVL